MSTNELKWKRRDFPKTGGWFRTPNEIFEFLATVKSPTIAHAVYSYLSYRATNSTQQCYPSTSRIAGDLGVSRSSVSKAIQELRKRRIIAIKPRFGKSTIYIFLHKQHWTTSDSQPVVLNDNPRSSGGQVPVAKKHTNKTKHSDLYNKAKNAELHSQKSHLKFKFIIPQTV